MKFVELNHRITNGLVTFPGMPAVEIDAYLTREECAVDNGKAVALIDRIRMINISGTYLDAPLHCEEDGSSIADIPLEKLVDLKTVVIRMKKEKGCFDEDDFEPIATTDLNGYAILLHSGHDKRFGTDGYGEDPPYLTVEGAKWLIERGVVFIGIDSPLIDNMIARIEDGIPVHNLILSAKAVVCENLRGLEQMPDTGALLTAVPPAVEMSSFTARVFAKIL